MSDKPLLIVARSGRMLAASAVKAGYSPIVVDLFADLDTQQLSKHSYRVESLALQHLSPVLIRIKEQFPALYCIYGSGFEAHIESLTLLKGYFSVLGNSLESFANVLDKRQFFKRLKDLGINFPAVDFSVNRSKSGLIKAFDGLGGEAITRANRELTENEYWQEHIEGLPLSLLFLAENKQFQCIGFNRQWTEPHSYLFSGVISQCPLPGSEQQIIQHWLSKLLNEFQLCGLNSLDFIWDGQRSYVLEVNARPPASMTLYDNDFKNGLLAEHINACLGKATAVKEPASMVTAYQLIYAQQDMIIPEQFHWPEWTADRPRAGSTIGSGQPVCSMIAEAETAGLVQEKLADNKSRLLSGSLQV